MLKFPSFLRGVFFLSLMIVSAGAFAQEKTITGFVKDQKGNPLSKATVSAEGGKEQLTAADGTFSLSVPAGVNSLTVSFTEYETETVNIKNKTNVIVVLKHSVALLDSVVVVGYATQRRKDVTGAISSVKGEDVKNMPTLNVADALQGRVAGVEVVKSSGEPGAKSQITIRGVSSLNQPDPLYIIDGVRSSGNNVNPQDIATYDVLKDASAAAIYGAAAAGGVILITTKQGKGSTPTINFNSRYGITTPRVIKLLNKADFVRYKQLMDDAKYNNPNLQEEIAAMPDYDWVDALYNNGVEQNYNLSIYGSTSAVNYYVSGMHNNTKGVFIDNASTMDAIRVNSDIKISKSVKVGEQIYAYKKLTTPVKTDVVAAPFRTVPTGAAYSDDPEFPWGTFPYGFDGVNIMAQVKTASFDFPEDNFQGNAYVEIKLPVKYMTFKTTVGYTSQNWENDIYYRNYTQNPNTPSVTTLYRNVGKYQQSLLASVLAYDHTWGAHTLNLLGGYEQYKNFSSNIRGIVSPVLGTSFGYIPANGATYKVDGGYDPNGLVKSVFGRLNYDFSKKMYITLNCRRDMNFTVFGPENRAGVFPSVSAGWRISDEPFFSKALPLFGNLKFRASYGELGNSAIPPYKFTTTYINLGQQNFGNGAPTELSYTQEGFQNNDIRWETIKETNIGLDGDLLDGKIFFSIDWYNKTTKDLLYQVPVPFSSGVPFSSINALGGASPGAIYTNIGSVRNRGFDIAVGYKDNIKDFKYSVSFAGSINSNKVITLDGNDDQPLVDGDNNYPATSDGVWKGEKLTRTFAGHSFGEYWGLIADGIYQTNEEAASGPTFNGNIPLAGDLRYRDISGPEGKPDGVINNFDKTFIGNPYPKLSYGINITASWKKFDLAMLWNGVAGVDLYNGMLPYEIAGMNGGNVTSDVFKTSNFNGNGVTSLPAIQSGYGNYSNPSSFFVENGAYLKLKNIQLGYNLTGKFFQKLRIKNAKVYVMGNNLFCITNYRGTDPEIGSQFPTYDLGNVINNTASASNSGTTTRGLDRVARYPSVRTYSFGIDITF